MRVFTFVAKYSHKKTALALNKLEQDTACGQYIAALYFSDIWVVKYNYQYKNHLTKW